MKKISRRSFLTVAGAAAAAGLLSACGASSSVAASSAAASSVAASSTAASSEAAASSSLDDVDPTAFLSDKAIGVQLGTTGDIYISGDIDDGLLGAATVDEYKTGADAVQALMSGKIEAVVIDDQVAQKFVETNDALAILPTEYITEDYAICFAKGSEMTAKFNDAIKTRQDDGTLEAILAKYIDGDADAAGYVSDGSNAYANGELHMATNAAFEPYEFYQGQDVVGIDAEFAKAICDTLDYKLVIDDMDFDAIIAAVTSGKADFGMAGMTVTDERKESVDFTDSYCTGVQAIIYKK